MENLLSILDGVYEGRSPVFFVHGNTEKLSLHRCLHVQQFFDVVLRSISQFYIDLADVV